MKSKLIAVGMIACASCAPSKDQQFVGSAPEVSEIEQEVLVSGATPSEMESIAQKYQVRLLHLGLGLYGVQGATEAELNRLLPQAALQKNAKVGLKDEIKLAEDTSNACVPTSARASQLDVKATKNGRKISDMSQLKIGDQVSFEATRGGLFGLFARQVEGTKWIVLGPDFSPVARMKSEGDTLDLTVTVPGPHLIVAYVGESKDDCKQGLFNFGVTRNEEYQGAAALTPIEDMGIFRHLPMIGATQAWDIAKGEDVVIAIVDSGVNYNHPDLSPNIRVNSAEIPGNGIDDDGNTLVDDVVGWDFANGDAYPMDDNMHGTHVAGLAASAVSGVAPGAKILPVKVGRSVGGSDLGSISAGILYAVDQGAKIINLSLGGLGDSTRFMRKVIDYVEAHDVLIVAAAGNGDYQHDGIGDDNDAHPVSPAGWSTEHVLAVAAVNLDGALTKYSNFGRRSVDIAAPGGTRLDGDLATSPNVPLFAPYFLPEYKRLIAIQGTSMATPVTAGAAAVVLSARPDSTVLDVKAALMATVEKTSALDGKIASGGYLQVEKALLSGGQSLAHR